MTKPQTDPLGPPKAVSSTTLQSVVLYGLYLGGIRGGQSLYTPGARVGGRESTPEVRAQVQG